ncbi:RNA polymerase sigma factor [Occultella kanbiaonis]|uniref:RNA polymerase sigma factor n=1 Tax=Occultella kanbiaonis TaxID=2675754 RepID=UPI0013D1FC21|nr:sigma-70 family RNA polymerase sigma factor [Occultella kanbiaonis]
MTDDSDESVWQRVLAGDASAYGTIWRRHRDRVFRHHLTCGTPASDAEDLTAATFLELWRRRDAVRFVDRSLLPWLIVTAHNVSRNAARSRRRYHRFLAALPPPADVHDHAEDVVDERLAVVREAMAAARPADARLLAMTAVEGFTIREAAAALGLSESAAKMRLSRLRRSLRAVIGEQPLTEGGS